jgi:hypothetical protein
MAHCTEKNSAPLCAEPISGSARSEVIKLIRHRLHEPLGPTLLVLQLLLREEALSPQGVALIRMLQRSIKEEVRAIRELLTIIETFIQEPAQADSGPEQRLEESSQSRLSWAFSWFAHMGEFVPVSQFIMNPQQGQDRGAVILEGRPAWLCLMTGSQSSNVLLGNPAPRRWSMRWRQSSEKMQAAIRDLAMDNISAETSGYFSQTRPISKLT